MRHTMIHAGFRVLHALRAHRLFRPFSQGRGLILTFHHVRPWRDRGFAPNRALEITPEFLDVVVRTLRHGGYDIVALDDVPRRLDATNRGNPFVALTFDDGYRDLLDHAVPVLERHQAPFTAFVTTGFVERTGRLWWLELEALVRAVPSLALEIDGRRQVFALTSDTARTRAFGMVAGHLLKQDDGRLLATVLDLCERHGVPGHDLVDQLCMDWRDVETLAGHPLATIGCHTVSHPRLAGLAAAQAVDEVSDARVSLEARLQRPVDHLCYPYGNRHAAGAREFGTAHALGFKTAVTTRPGMVFAAHRNHLTALPRVSVNGFWQSADAIEVLASGAGTGVWRVGRRLDVR